jgi:hypothetical protein
MNKLVLGIALCMAAIGFTSCESSADDGVLSPDFVRNPATASSEKSDAKLANMTFSITEQDFGTIVQGESITKVYKFTNESEMDLIISSANGSCGCTIPKWPRRPIKPGQSGEIEVVFNSAGKKGKQTKKVYITANTYPVNNVIVLKGEVVAPE